MAKKSSTHQDHENGGNGGNGGNGDKKCPIAREDFKRSAKAVTISINGMPQAAVPMEFKTGSFGWNLNGKATIEVDGVPVPVQVGMNLTVIGSKEV
jgi:hypothetical protein